MKRLATYTAPVVCVLLLAACSGHQATPTVNPNILPQTVDSNTAVSTAALPSSETVGSGEINGLDNQLSPSNDQSSSNVTKDGIPCAKTMVTTDYHVHSFVGILINGRQIALPDGLGMYLPGADASYPFKYFTNTASCFYWIHTHDASGEMHVESPSLPASARATQTLYNLGTAFDVFAQPLSSTQIGRPYSGTVRAYVAQVHHTSGTQHTIAIVPGSYCKLYTGNPRTIPIYTHTTIWLEIGPTYVAPSSLPTIHYYDEW